MVSFKFKRKPCRCGSFFVVFILVLLLVVFPQTAFARSKKCLYQTLGVPRNCSEKDLKKAYHKAALKHHPDKGGNEDTFKEVQKAYEILSNPEQRRQYDQFGIAGDGSTPNMFHGSSHAQQTPHGNFNAYGPFSSGSSGPHASFEFSFGSGGQGSYGINLEDLLRQAMGGGGLGSGMFGGGGSRGTSATNNPFGMGMGHTAAESAFSSNVPIEVEAPCSLEDLYSGKTKKFRVKQSRNRSFIFEVKLKPGWKDGTKVKFRATGSRPAATFTIREKKHPMFTRRGDDLIYKFSLRGKRGQDVCLNLPLLNGETWTRTIPAKSSFLRPGQSLTVSGLGMPIKGGPHHGNLIIEFC